MTIDASLQLRHTNPPHSPGPRHDSLHMAEGLKYCWCMCSRCFLKYGKNDKSGQTGGICICRQCPCAEAYNATFPVYVPRHPASEG